MEDYKSGGYDTPTCLLLMLIAQQVVYGLNWVERLNGHFSKHGVPTRHRTIPEAGQFERLQFASVFGFLRDEARKRIYIILQAETLTLVIFDSANEIHRIEMSSLLHQVGVGNLYGLEDLILYGSLPSVGTMILFCVLLGIFAIGAPGVPGGTVMASLGIVTSVLGFGAEGTALLLAIFAIQDSFGTACNVTGDGALTLILTGYCEKHGLAEQTNIGVDL